MTMLKKGEKKSLRSDIQWVKKECTQNTKHKTHFVYEYKKSYKQKVKTECTQTIHKPTYPNIDEIEPNYDF